MHYRNNNRKGFTIVEIVIVIAVIAVLAAIMIPTFIMIQEDAEVSALKTSINNSFSVFASHQADNGGHYGEKSDYRFVKAKGITITNGVATGLTGATEEYIWDGKSDDVTTRDYKGLGDGDFLFPQKFGEFYIIQRGTR